MNTVEVPMQFLEGLLNYFYQRPFAEAEAAVAALRHLIQLGNQPKESPADGESEAAVSQSND